METLITRGIRVTVETKFQEEYSRPIANKYLFTYRITIENFSPHRVQLLRRHWDITDAHGNERIVEGDGVVGQQPILDHGEEHTYVSWCPLPTEIGKMSGSFTMVNMENDEEFDVLIPEFRLVAPFVYN